MKKIIGILVVLLITITVSGQKFMKSVGFTERTPHWENGQQAHSVEEHIYDYGFYYTHENKRIFRIDVVHFMANGRVFMLSYEPIPDRLENTGAQNIHNLNIEAKIFLYSKDMSKPKSEWEMASVRIYEGRMRNSPVLISTYTDGRNYNDVDFYIYDKDYHNTSIGKVIELENGVVEMVIGYYERNEYGVTNDTPLTFIFTPVDDKHYTFEKK